MNKSIKYIIFSLLVFNLFWLTGCEKDNQNTLIVTPDNIEFETEGGYTSITIQTDADSWNITNPASDWLILSNTQGTEKSNLVTLGVVTKTVVPRLDTLTVTAGNANPVKLIVSQPSSDYLYSILVNNTTLSFLRGGNTLAINITTDAPEWNINADVDWLKFTPDSGSNGNTTISITALENTGTDPRTATIILGGAYAASAQISVAQKGEYYPSYNTSPIAPDATGMTSTAAEIAANINLGTNIGNSLEAIGGETSWGNPLISKALVDLIKQNGFNAIRLPCSWNQYMSNSATAQLSSDWLERVKTVIQYCIDDDMYVILNIHWDGGWLENNCTIAKQEENNAKQKAFWEQIATHLRDFDEHLLFASANEPNVDNAAQMSVLTSYHQTFINAVRSTGGKNSYRVLVVQGPSTDIQKTNQLMSVLPIDEIANRMMVEIHYYTPWNFCGLTEDASWGSMFYYWGKDYHSTTDPTRNSNCCEESMVDSYFSSMKTKFADKGIPIVLGEYGAVRRSSLTGDALTLHLASRAYYLKYVTQQAKANGMLPFYWDAGGTGTNGSALFNRRTNTVFDQQALDAILQGGAK